MPLWATRVSRYRRDTRPRAATATTAASSRATARATGDRTCEVATRDARLTRQALVVQRPSRQRDTPGAEGARALLVFAVVALPRACTRNTLLYVLRREIASFVHLPLPPAADVLETLLAAEMIVFHSVLSTRLRLAPHGFEPDIQGSDVASHSSSPGRGRLALQMFFLPVAPRDSLAERARSDDLFHLAFQ
ncbi:hypothetical protein HPB50_013783 [Hyalomma asiaticum]|uniref:Uncharacterized protein n=1 Tax=Hyalomma asiaticum TaxID=266040 RepID=A0ACB7THJ9_HYAAI|nr:hypothetical protein HPB50_013783 [Hyalomma asiaticum]